MYRMDTQDSKIEELVNSDDTTSNNNNGATKSDESSTFSSSVNSMNNSGNASPGTLEREPYPSFLSTRRQTKFWPARQNLAQGVWRVAKWCIAPNLFK